VTSKDIIACNGFGFKGLGDTHWACGCSSHYSFSFSPDVRYNRKKLSQLCQDGTCTYLPGVV